jgi:hypothetical protein
MSNNIDLTKIVTIRVRRDTSTAWQQKNPILKNGEPGLETDTRKIKFGDGTSQWNELNYSGIDINDPLLIENIDDRVSLLIKSGSNISVVYNDNLNELTISAVGLQMAGNYATLVNGTIPSNQLPSYVDDVLEFASLTAFPLVGEVGKIYVSLDTNKSYRWSGSTYIEINVSAPVQVQSVAGKTGVVTLNKNDVGLNNVDNTSDANKPVSTAQQTALDLKAPLASPTFTGNVSIAPSGNLTISPNSTLTLAAGDIFLPSNNVRFYTFPNNTVFRIQNNNITVGRWRATPVEINYGGTGGSTLSEARSNLAINNVDNTSDANKPVSTAQQNAFDLKANKTEIFNAAVRWTENHTLVDGTRYLAGDIVYNNGNIYRAKFDNESLPVSNTTYWENLGSGFRLNIDGRDIPNIPFPVTSVNGLTGSVIIDRLVKDDQEVVLGSDGRLTHPDGTINSGGTVIAPGTYNIQSIDNTLIQTSANAGAKSWNFETNGNLTFPSGSILSETNNTVSLMPPTAASGQSLVIRPTAAAWTMNSSGYIVYGSPITITVTLQGWPYFGTVNYTISGTGVTEQSLGRALTGKLTFVSTDAPDGETITWTIPANSDISEFTITLTSVDGTRSTNEETQNDPALYYDFEEFNGMPIGQFITVTNNGISSSEHSHVHLVSGDPATVDIYLGDDDQYVKIEKNGGDVIVGTKSEAVVNRLTLITNGTGYAVTPNDVAVLGGSGTGMRVNYANNGGSVIVVVLNTLGTGYQDGDILTLSGGNANCTFRYNNHNAIYNNWTFGADGSTTLPNGVSIDEYYGSQFPRIVADTGKAFSVQGQGSTGSAALAWMESASTSSQYAAVGVSKGGGDNLANVVITAGASTPTLKVWRFDENGRLTLPIDGDILDSNGTSVLGGSTTVVSSSYSSTIDTDASAGDIFDTTLTGNTTLSNPTNPVNGKTIRWRITQDSTGNRTVTLGNKFNIPSTATSPLPFSTAANKTDILAATYHAGRDKWDIVAFVPGY